VDPHLSVLAERSVTGVLDPMSRLAVGTALDARQFVSDPFFPDAFKKYVLRIDVPVKSRQESVIGVLGGRYDIQEALQSLANTARFNASGYAVVVSHTGRAVAHPDPKRVNDDLSGAVNAMVRGLRERDTIKQVFGQYVAGHYKRPDLFKLILDIRQQAQFRPAEDSLNEIANAGPLELQPPAPVAKRMNSASE